MQSFLKKAFFVVQNAFFMPLQKLKKCIGNREIHSLQHAT